MTLDELRDYGIVHMEEAEIDEFLSSQSVGVLGLPTDGAPSLRPISFWYDGEETLYLPYIVAHDSRKAALSDRAEAARFLVYRAETAFNWRSVLLTGTIEAVPEEERGAVEAAMDIAWRPEVFERVSEGETTRLYRLHVEKRVGTKHLGLPPAFEEPED
jgi:hypothetical protein